MAKTTKSTIEAETVNELKVELLYPGSFFSEDESYPVRSRNPKEIAKKYPRAFAFKFYEQTKTTMKIAGEEQAVYGKPTNESPMYYPGGKVLNVEDVKALPGNHEILLSNMRSSKWDHVVKTRHGNFQPFEKGSEIL